MTNVMFQSDIADLPLLHRGKVRDIYGIGDDHLLIVTTDRLSAFDVVLPTPIPDKGRVLTALSQFWFQRLEKIIPNHLSTITLAEVITDAKERQDLEDRSMIVRKLKNLPVEAVVRGYLAGSGWKEYRQQGAICGVPLPAGLREADRLPEPIFTPSTKAEIGTHDENIDFAEASNILGQALAEQIHTVSIKIYQDAAAYALQRGIIIADTKFEFGLDTKGQLVLIDEVLTPDSSRFWPVNTYTPGQSPPSFDKQYIRDYLESTHWNKQAPAPELPPLVVMNTTAKYREALQRLTA